MQLQFAATGAPICAATSRSEACQHLKCVVHLRLELSVLSFFSGLGAIFSCMVETICSSAFDKTVCWPTAFSLELGSKLPRFWVVLLRLGSVLHRLSGVSRCIGLLATNAAGRCVGQLVALDLPGFGVGF